MAALTENSARVAFFRPIAENNVPYLRKIMKDNADFDFVPTLDSCLAWWTSRVAEMAATAPTCDLKAVLASEDKAVHATIMVLPMMNELVGVLSQVLSCYFHGSWDFSFTVGVSLGLVSALALTMSKSRDELLGNVPKAMDILYFIVRGTAAAGGEGATGDAGLDRKCMMSVSGKRGAKVLTLYIKPILREFKKVRVGVEWSQNGMLLSGMPDDLEAVKAKIEARNVPFLYVTLIPVGFPMHNDFYNKAIVKEIAKYIDTQDCDCYAYNTPILDLAEAEMLEDLEGADLAKRIVELICSEPNRVPMMEDGVPVGKKLAVYDYGCGGMRGGVIGMIQDALSNMEDDEFELYNYHHDGCKQNIQDLKSDS